MFILASCEGRPGLAAASQAIADGRSALDAVEMGIREVEASPYVNSVGRGGTPDLLGQMSCDAAVMDGTTLQAGAVAALKGYLHAVSVARAVMERLPHVLLVESGAARFAREIHAERARLLTRDAESSYRKWLRHRSLPVEKSRLRSLSLVGWSWVATRSLATKGTVVYLAVDKDGRMAGGTSTSGLAYRYPGRIGDSPIVGAGLYVDDRYGACGCTHVGEMTIRAGTARSVVLYMKQGATVEEACHQALLDLADLRGGFLGPVMLHALDSHGKACVVANRRMGRRFDAHWWSGRGGWMRIRTLTPLSCR